MSQTIVVSANKVTTGDELTPWVRLLSRNAFGNFRTLLRKVSLSPTMGKYLDNVFNRKATTTTSPNENYARELLQLFSIGTWDLNNDGSQKLDGGGQPIPSYSQATIANFARALTGWTYPPRPGATSGNSNPEYFVGVLVPTSNATRHDTDPKALLSGVVIAGRPDRAARPRPGGRQHLPAPERAAVHRHAADPLDGHVEPQPGLRRPGVGRVHQQRRRGAR